MIDWLWANAEKLGAMATIVAAFVGMGALIFAALQIASGRNVAMETTALQAYQDYLRSCIDRPHLGTWKMFSAWSGHKTADQLEAQTDAKAEAYVWLLSDMLMTCELALIAARRDPSWLNTIDTQIELHAPAIQAVWPHWRSVYSQPLRKVVDASLVRLAPSLSSH